MKIVCIGGGPAGLYFGILMKKQDPANEIVGHRAQPGVRHVRLGRGVLRPDARQSRRRRRADGEDRSCSRSTTGTTSTSSSRGAKSRPAAMASAGSAASGCSTSCRRAARSSASSWCSRPTSTDERAVAAAYGADLVIACDGLNSGIRARYADAFRPDVENRRCRFVWLGTKKRFDAFTFAFEETEHGWFQAHIYQFDGDTSTFIVETPEDVWQKAGLDRMSQEEGIRFCERLFAAQLDGHPLLSNAAHLRGSAIWIRFPRIVCGNWVHRIDVDGRVVPVVLMGDAAHTAHYSIGSGTKLALEDAIELARCCATHGAEGMDKVLAAYQDARSVEVLKIQSAAKNSMEWFENVDRYTHLEAEQFAYSMLTRSQRIPHENLRLRDAGYVERYENWIAAHAFAQAGTPVPQTSRSIPPMLTPFRARGVVAQEPDRRVADGPVLGAGRHPRRLPPCSPRRARDGRGRTGICRDDLRVAGRADHARLPGTVERCAARRLASRRRFRPRRDRREDRACSSGTRAPRARRACPGRAARTGRCPPATGRSSPPARSSISPAFRRPRAKRRATTGADQGRFRRARRAAPRRPASTGSSCTARTAICCPRSSRRSPTGATTNTAAISPAVAGIRSRCSRPFAPRGPPTGRSACGYPRTTGRRVASRPTTPSPSAGCSRPPART